ncbi:MAG: helix-turn-helix domain-containing protein [Deltaproteobacteria bacterium]|nr:helix-turn-helix domain-containing protein [Deltaproteobacteria bacterium]
MLTPSPLTVLRALFDLAQRARPAGRDALTSRTGLPPSQVARALRHLEARGLVDAARCRLTLAGLAFAVAARAAEPRASDATSTTARAA